MSIARKIAHYVTNLRFEDIPSDVLEYSKFALADYYAVSYAGINTTEARIIKDYADEFNNSHDCTVFGSNKKYSAPYAALINGMISHALDYDDVGLTAINHPSVTNAPVTIALAEQLGKSGKEALFAFTVAIEIQHKIALALMPMLTNKGWHTTSIFGTLGAATAASILYGFDEDQFVNTLGIAVSLASGVRGNFGTTTKSFHAGMAAQNGILAAKLCQKGLTSSEKVFECNDGFALAFADTNITEADIKLGEPWDAQFAGFQFKKYPVCSSSHTALDAFDILRKKYHFSYDDIEEVTAGTSEFTFRNLIFNNPVSPQQAKFSMPYGISCLAIYKQLTLEEFTEDAIFDSRVQTLMPKIKMVLDDMYKDAGILSNEPALVTVRLKDGTILKERVEYALGTIKNPLSKEQIKVKFDNCLKGYKQSDIDTFFHTIFAMEDIVSIQEFIDVLPKS